MSTNEYKASNIARYFLIIRKISLGTSSRFSCWPLKTFIFTPIRSMIHSLIHSCRSLVVCQSESPVTVKRRRSRHAPVEILFASNPGMWNSAACFLLLAIWTSAKKERREHTISTFKWAVNDLSFLTNQLLPFSHFVRWVTRERGEQWRSRLHVNWKPSFPCILSLDWTHHISLDHQTFSGTRKPRYYDRCSFPNWANHIDHTHQRICTHSYCCNSIWPVQVAR